MMLWAVAGASRVLRESIRITMGCVCFPGDKIYSVLRTQSRNITKKKSKLVNGTWRNRKRRGDARAG